MYLFFFLMIRRPPRSTRTDTLFPYTTLFLSLHDSLVASLQKVQIDDDDTPDEIGSIAQSAEALRLTAAAPPRNQNIGGDYDGRSEEHTSELQSLMRTSYAVFCLKKQKHNNCTNNTTHLNPA